MITVFTCPKAFKGHIGMIQRNALAALQAMRDTCEVVLVGDDEGTRDAARDFDCPHVDAVDTNEHGTPLLTSVFDRAQAMARYDILAYVNADIVLDESFVDAVAICAAEPEFLLVGERLDLDVTESLSFGDESATQAWFQDARTRGVPAGDDAIDYFVFRRGFWKDMPPFALGRTAWDNWMLYHARTRGAKLINCSETVTAIHQNHDYAHTREQSKDAMWKGEEARQNRKMAGQCFFDLVDSNYVIRNGGIRRATGDPFVRRRMDRLEEYHPALWRALMSWKLRYWFCYYRTSL